MILVLPIKLPDGSEPTLSLHPLQHPSRFSLHDNVLWFDLPRGASVHLLSGDNPDLSLPDPQPSASLPPATTCRAHWSAMLHGGQAELWCFEYDQHQRLTHWTADIHQGHQQHRWKTHANHRSLRLSLQLRGAGHLWIEKIICSEA